LQTADLQTHKLHESVRFESLFFVKALLSISTQRICQTTKVSYLEHPPFFYDEIALMETAWNLKRTKGGTPCWQGATANRNPNKLFRPPDR